MSKKLFKCGHRGKGQYCHRCQQSKTERERKLKKERAIQERKEKAREQSQFLKDKGIIFDANGTPQNVIEKAWQIVKKISEGISPFHLKGKKLKQGKNLISIPIGRNYRLLCLETLSSYKPFHLLTHENYNKKINQLA